MTRRELENQGEFVTLGAGSSSFRETKPGSSTLGSRCKLLKKQIQSQTEQIFSRSKDHMLVKIFHYIVQNVSTI